MLNIDRDHLTNLDSEQLKKHRTSLLIVATLLLVGGLLCLSIPFSSGLILSIVIGIMLLLNGIGMIISMIINRATNILPMVGGILLGVAYLLIGYQFICHPLTGVLTVSIWLGILFALGGISRLITSFSRRKDQGKLWSCIIGILDLIIAWALVGPGLTESIVIVMTIIGIEMLVSSFSLFQVTNLLKSC